LKAHPDVRRVIPYDKRGTDSGISGLFRLRAILRAQRYDLALVPHRSLRSALLAAFAAVPRRIGFATSAGKFLMTDVVVYRNDLHEVDRNLELLRAVQIVPDRKDHPHLYPSSMDMLTVDQFLLSHGIPDTIRLIGMAPGTVWNTKRWPKEGFIALNEKLRADGFHVVLIGGKEDAALCREICSAAQDSSVSSSAGVFSLLQSAEMIRRCRLLICNDSAPMHLAVAMQTPVVAIFGATIPEFGFAPFGKYDVVLETKGLSCRPCSIHGGDRCPISTFDCMVRISAEQVYARVHEVLGKSQLIAG